MRKQTILAGLLFPAAIAWAAPATLSAVKRSATPAAPAKDASMMGSKSDAMMPGDAMMGGAMMGGGSALPPEHVKFFNEKIQPILTASCYKCHSEAEGKSKGGLTLDTREALRRGGDSGPAIKAGAPEVSLLIKAVEYKDPDMQMPPKSTGGKLPDADIALLKEWVKMGAPDPRSGAAKAIAAKLSGLTDKARSHWSFQPVKKPAVPRIQNASWCLTPVDAFIMQKIEEKGLVASPFAEKETLIRRAYFDLIGLPPTPAQIDAFEKDTSPQAFAKVVEGLLASPHYGERWGRFWLDTARYADTVGGDRNNNDKDDYRYPYAWTFRDWVVNALNQDMPYDQFIVHQLAADLVPNNDPKNAAALGFITVGERFNNNNDLINDRIDVVSKGFLGLTVSCARCHDHMFDPIPTKDYYALHGVFRSIYEPDEKPMLNKPDPAKLKEFEAKIAEYEEGDRKTYFDVLEDGARQFRQKASAYLTAARLGGSNNEEKLKQREKLIEDEKLDEQLANYARNRMRANDRVWGPLHAFLDMAEGDYDFLGHKKVDEVVKGAGKKYNPYIAEKFRGFKLTSIEQVLEVYGKTFEEMDAKCEEAMKAARKVEKGKPTEIDRDLLELAGGIFRVHTADQLDTERVRDAVEAWPLRMRNKGRYNFAAINELKLTHDGAPAKAMVVADRKDPRDSAVFVRGQSETPGETVPRGFLEVLSPGGKRMAFTKGSGRLELAQAVANKDNPLTARVIVNRVWLYHFGEGFVRTPDDLGTQAEKPSHPELIDYLAHWFVNEGKWSLKNLHRMIMLSKVYQIRSYAVKANEDIDPDNRYLWRANVRRLDFEAMRDSLLVMSGKLDRTLNGQPVNLTDEPYSFRRSIYGYIDRGNLPELMAHFDFSDPHMTNSKRTTTIVPQQALFLMNSPFTVDVARRIIARPEVKNAPDDIRRVHSIYKIVFSRLPKPHEVKTAFDFLREEAKAEPQMAGAAAELASSAQKKLDERISRRKERGMNDAYRAISNEGDFVQRKPLTAWETFAQALLLSNEAAYVN